LSPVYYLAVPLLISRLIPATSYLNAYYGTGMLDTAQGYNLQKECKKIKGLARAGAKVGSPYRSEMLIGRLAVRSLKGIDD
jgi:hypothetical protein